MSRNLPRCPDCGSFDLCSVRYGEVTVQSNEARDCRSATIDLATFGKDGPKWQCKDCGRRFGHWGVSPDDSFVQSRDEWSELIRSMLPEPVQSLKGGVLVGGEPRTVIVQVQSRHIVILEAGLECSDVTRPARVAHPFAAVKLSASPARVAELIALCHGKRIGSYRWCPKCHRRTEPERMSKGVCHGCAETFQEILH
ncbi:MAG: hypothetical protein QM784_40180 [Polyangiaceae bacterium]